MGLLDIRQMKTRWYRSKRVYKIRGRIVAYSLHGDGADCGIAGIGALPGRNQDFDAGHGSS